MNGPAPSHTAAPPTSASDISDHSWVTRFLPYALRPYARLARLDRPIGTWLLLFPCWWSLTLATTGWPDGRLVALFAVGALVMRGAGCTYNDIVDRNLDGRVARTRTRPIPAGEVSVTRAILFLAVQLAAGLAILLSFNNFAILLGVAALPLVFAYPFMKRITYWPQIWLGLTFNWGALLGWAAVRGDLDWPALLLYAAGIGWTLGYDTIYAHQDKEDDALIGIKSTALRLGSATRRWLLLFYGATIVLAAAAAYMAGSHWLFYVGLAAASGHLAWQGARLDIDDAARCLTLFRANRGFGWLLLAAFLAGRLAA